MSILKIGAAGSGSGEMPGASSISDCEEAQLKHTASDNFCDAAIANNNNGLTCTRDATFQILYILDVLLSGFVLESFILFLMSYPDANMYAKLYVRSSGDQKIRYKVTLARSRAISDRPDASNKMPRL